MNKPAPVFNPVILQERIENMPVQQVLQQSAHTTQMLKRDPRNVQAHFAMAVLHKKTGQILPAITHLKKAHKLQPKAEFVLKLLCELLMKNLGKYAEALKYLQKWQRLRNDDSSALIWVCIAECQIEMGRTDAAFKALDRAKRINPDEQRVYLVSSNIYGKTGDLDAATEFARKALEIEPNEMATAALSRLPNFGEDLETVESVVKVAEQAENPRSIAYLHGVASTGFEKLGDYERAFRHLELSNELPREKLDKETTIAAFANLKETFTREFFEARKGLGHPSEQPIFIVGMPRSGTTLTESILAGHPKISDNGELEFLFRFMDSVGLQKRVDPMLKEQMLTLHYHLHGAPPDYFRSLAEGYMDESGFDRKNKNMQVDKLPHNFMSVGLIATIFPNAKIIHCRRHPVDCALSCYRQTFREFHTYATDIGFLGLYYRQYWELMKHWREVLPGKMFEICYEDTVANKELVARNLIDHIGLEWDDRCLDHTASKTTVSTASQWQVRQPIYTTSVAKWKHYEKQLQPMIKNMGSCVEEYEAELAAMSE